MKSTGEVMGLDSSFERAFAKSQLGAGVDPAGGRHGVPLGQGRRQDAACRRWRAAWSRWASPSWRPAAPPRASARPGLPVTVVNKVLEGRPHCVDAIRSGEVQLVINTASDAAVDRRQLRDPPQRADARRAALHDDGRRAGRGARDRGAASRERLKSRRCSPIFAVRSEPRRGRGLARRAVPRRSSAWPATRLPHCAFVTIEGPSAVQKFPMTAPGLQRLEDELRTAQVGGAPGDHPRDRRGAHAWRPVGERRIPRRARTPVLHRGPHRRARGDRLRRSR